MRLIMKSIDRNEMLPSKTLSSIAGLERRVKESWYWEKAVAGSTREEKE